MTTLEDFEAALSDVLQAKRLSQSKMTKLTEIAMKLMEDTQLVSTMYRTHKSLPTSCKISSLYVFDALARAARQQVIKHNLSERHSTGNCATFLSKMAGVLEGLFQDMLATGLTEAKEKTKKIYDIWVKGNTFPSGILSRLSDIVSGKDKEPEANPLVAADSRLPPATSLVDPISSTALPTTDPQATLLALLTQAASQHIPQTTANPTASPTTPLESPQIAILHYLQSASVNKMAANQISPIAQTPVQDFHVTQTPTDPRISKSSFSPPDELVPIGEGERDNYRSPPRIIPSHDRNHDDRGYSRNDYRGSSRRRGRWNRWDERERDRDRYRDQSEGNWNSTRRGGHSRSRSPDVWSRQRDSPALSPRRPSHVYRGQNDDDTPGKPTNHDPGKDEFGRDLRPSSPPTKSPSPPTATHFINASSTMSSTSHDRKADSSTSTSTSIDPMSRSSSIAANTSSKEPNGSVTSPESSTKNPQTGLESFDISAFNPTSPASWEALGKMWRVTNGYQPSTEELMQFIMMGAMSQSMISGTWQQGAVASEGMNGSDHSGGGAVSQGGREYGASYGSVRNGHHGWTNNHSEEKDQLTDAVVLGGGDGSELPDQEGSPQQSSVGPPGRAGGKMQKVGDKWVFVRRDGTS